LFTQFVFTKFHSFFDFLPMSLLVFFLRNNSSRSFKRLNSLSLKEDILVGIFATVNDFIFFVDELSLGEDIFVGVALLFVVLVVVLVVIVVVLVGVLVVIVVVLIVVLVVLVVVLVVLVVVLVVGFFDSGLIFSNIVVFAEFTLL